MMPYENSKPNGRQEIAAQILTLLNLFWQGDETPETRKAIAKVWIEDFVEFDPLVVAEVCRDWRREEEARRPSIAALRKRCREAQENANWRRERALPKPESDVPAWFDAAMQRDWSAPEYDGDCRSPWQRRSDAIAVQRSKRMSPEDMQRGGRALCNQWARTQGYPDFAAAERAGRLHSEVVTWVLATAQPKRMPSAPDDPPIPANERERIRRNSLIEAADAA